jgi:hypothetical protein
MYGSPDDHSWALRRGAAVLVMIGANGQGSISPLAACTVSLNASAAVGGRRRRRRSRTSWHWARGIAAVVTSSTRHLYPGRQRQHTALNMDDRRERKPAE